MSAWRDAAEECGYLWCYGQGWGDFHLWLSPPAELTSESCLERYAYAAGYYEAKANAALDAAEAKPPAPTRLDVALAALKRLERTGRNVLSLPSCPACRPSATHHDYEHKGRVRRVTVKHAIKHRPDCELARALRWEDSP